MNSVCVGAREHRDEAVAWSCGGAGFLPHICGSQGCISPLLSAEWSRLCLNIKRRVFRMVAKV